MDIPSLSQHEQALKFRALRNQVLSSNIANADTPNYKARDIDFKAAMTKAHGNTMSLASTSRLHQQGTASAANGSELLYRVPHQPSLDGNTVETDVEQAKFAENALHYRTSLAFMDSKIRGLKYALKGGD